jgi:hypothetical protein
VFSGPASLKRGLLQVPERSIHVETLDLQLEQLRQTSEQNTGSKTRTHLVPLRKTGGACEPGAQE